MSVKLCCGARWDERIGACPRCGKRWETSAEERNELYQRISELQDELAAKHCPRCTGEERDGWYCPECVADLIDARIAFHREAESLRARVAALEALARGVSSGMFNVYADDVMVDGKKTNWFDARRQLLDMEVSP